MKNKFLLLLGTVAITFHVSAMEEYDSDEDSKQIQHNHEVVQEYQENQEKEIQKDIEALKKQEECPENGDETTQVPLRIKTQRSIKFPEEEKTDTSTSTKQQSTQQSVPNQEKAVFGDKKGNSHQ
ncbi:MAG: hypothetical protein ACTSXG_02135 [Alphaproteobacteria bacterium]